MTHELVGVGNVQFIDGAVKLFCTLIPNMFDEDVLTFRLRFCSEANLINITSITSNFGGLTLMHTLRDGLDLTKYYDL